MFQTGHKGIYFKGFQKCWFDQPVRPGNGSLLPLKYLIKVFNWIPPFPSALMISCVHPQQDDNAWKRCSFFFFFFFFFSTASPKTLTFPTCWIAQCYQPLQLLLILTINIQTMSKGGGGGLVTRISGFIITPRTNPHWGRRPRESFPFSRSVLRVIQWRYETIGNRLNALISRV